MGEGSFRKVLVKRREEEGVWYEREGGEKNLPRT
jgi:hypothetical protein